MIYAIKKRPVLQQIFHTAYPFWYIPKHALVKSPAFCYTVLHKKTGSLIRSE